MTAQEMLIKKFHIQTHILLDYKLSWGKNNNIYIVEQLETVHSYICIVAFHLGMKKNRVNDVISEPSQKTVNGGYV